MSETDRSGDNYNPAEHGLWPATLDDAEGLGYPDNYFFADTTRALVTAITDFFSSMWVIRYDEKGYPRKRIQVPIKFGPRSKAHDFRREDVSGKTYYVPLPNIYFKISGIEYDESRATSSYEVRDFYEKYFLNSGIDSETTDLFWRDVQPIPYNYNIELSAKCDKFSDLLQITEQILGKFNPDSFLYIREFWFSDIRRDIKLVLNSISLDYNDEYSEEERRDLSATLSFKAESLVYANREVSGALIEKIIATLSTKNFSVTHTIE